MSDRTGAAARPEAAPEGRWARLRAGLAHAFSLEPEVAALDDEDRAVLDRVARAVHQRRLTTPAVMWLESMRPLHFLGSQAMLALRPIAHAVLPPDAYDRFARILERRDGIEELLKRIEAQGDG